MSAHDWHGLYAITADAPAHGLVDAVEQAIAGGARVIQYRDKRAAEAVRHATAQALADLCRRHTIPLIINDDVELARACRADGVHLGDDDLPLATAREWLGAGAIIGISCYNDLARARAAVAGGADYLAFGRCYPSRSKPGTVMAGPDLLRTARTRFDLPLVAIGGITPENGGPLLAAGADMLAAIHGVFGQDDIRHAAGRYADLCRAAATHSVS